MGFIHSVHVWIRVWDGYLYPRYPSCIHVLKSEKTKTQSKHEKSLNWTWFGRIPVDMSFIVMPSLMKSS